MYPAPKPPGRDSYTALFAIFLWTDHSFSWTLTILGISTLVLLSTLMLYFTSVLIALSFLYRAHQFFSPRKSSPTLHRAQMSLIVPTLLIP